ncbi:MAG: metallophosphoesterase [Candidatus Hydrogenedentes bacterium]|nr:metallophosphoesterase [Candidatus Hydrogenedentota bacterium]
MKDEGGKKGLTSWPKSMLLLWLGLAAVAAAREDDGRLGLLRTPNNGMPAIVQPGSTFVVETLEKAELSLLRDSARVPLGVTWKEAPGSRFRGEVSVPTHASAGAYALEAKTNGSTDTTARAVFIVDAFPDYYVLAHLSDTHIGSDRHAQASEVIVGQVISAVNASEASLALVTGDLADQGTPEQFQKFLEVLDTCRVPTFVCPGNHDREGQNYENYFGPVTYSFLYGRDGYLAFDTKDFVIADEVGTQDGELQVMRRAIKPQRWSMGFTHRYDASMGMRAQLTLFVDDPLDYLFFGHWHRENTAEEAIVPWGTTKVSVVPAAIDGAYRLIDVTESRVLFRPVQR